MCDSPMQHNRPYSCCKCNYNNVSNGNCELVCNNDQKAHRIQCLQPNYSIPAEKRWLFGQIGSCNQLGHKRAKIVCQTQPISHATKFQKKKKILTLKTTHSFICSKIDGMHENTTRRKHTIKQSKTLKYTYLYMAKFCKLI